MNDEFYNSDLAEHKTNELLKLIKEKYTDIFGLVVTSQMDGGDTSHKMSHLAIARYLQNNDGAEVFIHALTIQVWALGLIRHPDPAKWYSNPKTFSRDQFSPRVICAAFIARFSIAGPKILKEYFFAHLKHLLLFAWNTRPSWNEGTNRKMPDLTGPENWGFYIRGFNLWPLYPLLFICDLETLVNATIKRFDSDFDINNGLAAQLLAMKRMPTGIGHLAYTIMRPVIEKKLLQYWDPARYEPPIGQMYIEGLKQQGLL